ncbi:hypothetical protein NPIL_433921 [Nephila pilipes]|uniref:Uncharacterized protein n=1 Tax=Nephila pilipes TaxID=299642 RepID=A0A8X6MTC3_NEPPI|nr:hypothetical protein NPIL_433921 [Nephila pilipes]
MMDHITLVLETCLYILYWHVFGSDVPSFLEILCYSTVIELAKVYSLLEFPLRYNLSGHYSVEWQGNFTNNDVPIISSATAFTIYHAVDMKENFAPDRDVIKSNSLKAHKINIDPIVHSEDVYRFCQALDLRAKLAPLESRVVFNPTKRWLK